MIEASYITHKGKVAEHQEDSLLFGDKVIQSNIKKPITASFEKNGIFAVSDGIAGLRYGEVASLKTLTYLHKLFVDRLDEQNIINLIKKTQDKLALLSLNEVKYYGMGATLAGIVFEKDCAKVFNVGDSRVYIFRGDKLENLTIDHTVARKMCQRGELGSSEDCANAYKMLDSAIVASTDADDFEIHTLISEVKIGDRFLICTDGVTDMVEESEIKRVFVDFHTTNEIALELFKKAMENGGEDNLSMIAIEKR